MRKIIVLLLSDNSSWFRGVFPHFALFFFLISKIPRQSHEGLKSTLSSSVFFKVCNDNDSNPSRPGNKKTSVPKVTQAVKDEE